MLKKFCVVASAMAALLLVGSPAFANPGEARGGLIGDILENVNLLNILSTNENTDVDITNIGDDGWSERNRECCERNHECCEHPHGYNHHGYNHHGWNHHECNHHECCDD